MMATFRVPIWFAIIGAVLKTMAMVGWRVSGSIMLFRLVTVHDPVSLWLAEAVVAGAFREHPIWPSLWKMATYELVLVLGFALQCLLLGMVVQLIMSVLEYGYRARGTAGSRRT